MVQTKKQIDQIDLCKSIKLLSIAVLNLLHFLYKVDKFGIFFLPILFSCIYRKVLFQTGDKHFKSEFSAYKSNYGLKCAYVDFLCEKYINQVQWKMYRTTRARTETGRDEFKIRILTRFQLEINVSLAVAKVIESYHILRGRFTGLLTLLVI